MKSAIFDSNVYDLLAKDRVTTGMVRMAIKSGKLTVIVPRVIAAELQASPFKGVPALFPVQHMGNTVARSGFLACGDSLGQGQVFDAHLGTSKKINDALVADAADWNSDIVVSEDGRLRKRLNNNSTKCLAVSYTEFIKMLHDL